MAAKPVRQFATAWKPRVPSQTRLSLPWNRRFHSTLTDVDQLLLTRAHEIRQSLTYHRLHLQTTELVCSGCAAQGTRIRTGQLGRPFCHLLCFIQVDPLQRRSDRNDLQAPLCTVRGERVNNKAKKKKKKNKKGLLALFGLSSFLASWSHRCVLSSRRKFSTSCISCLYMKLKLDLRLNLLSALSWA